jgi:hypothetical protein
LIIAKVLHDEKYPYLVLHGLNGVYIEEISRWIRLDARGNFKGIDAQFSLDEEKLTFSVRKSLGEEDIFTVFTNPNHNFILLIKCCKVYHKNEIYID